MDHAPPPWFLEGEAVVAFRHGANPSSRFRTLGRLSMIIAARYAVSPVGPYVELALGRPARRGGRVGLEVTTMLVDSAASEAAGRRNWGFPKQVAGLSWDADGPVRTLHWADGAVRVVATTARCPGVPVVVPLRALQHHGEAVVVPGGLRARAGLVRVSVSAPADGAFHRFVGTRSGLLLTELRLTIGRPLPERTNN